MAFSGEARGDRGDGGRIGMELLTSDDGPGPRRRAEESGPLNGAFLGAYDERRAEPGRPSTRSRSAAGPSLQASMPGAAILPELVGHELILDENNLLPFHFLRRGDEVGRAVVKIERGDGASGTGFLVATDVVLTNHHVLPTVDVARAARAVANFEAGCDGEPAAVAAPAALRPEALFVTDADLDFTFCGVGGLDALGVIPLDRNSLGVLKGELVNIIQHPRGRPKEVALQDNQVVKADNVVLQYSCDTEPGSSGSPVFNNRWQLVALHHASISAPGVGRRAQGCDPEGRYLNEGIRLSAIALWLETANAQATGGAGVARLRSLFRGLDPQIGFFGALGRVARPAQASAFVVEAYRGGGDDLDIAYWDLRPLGRALGHRVAELGWLLADLGIDVWCLAGATAEQARVLCDNLETNSRSEYRCLAGSGSGRSPMAVLYRTTKGLSAEVGPSGPDGPVRLLVRSPGAWRRPVAVALAPLAPPGDGPDLVAALRGAGLGGPEARVVLGGPGHAASPEAMAILAELDPAPRLAAGPEGLLAILPGAGVGVGLRDAYLSANLAPALGPPDLMRVALDRHLSPDLATLAGTTPVAARLTFG